MSSGIVRLRAWREFNNLRVLGTGDGHVTAYKGDVVVVAVGRDLASILRAIGEVTDEPEPDKP